MHKAYKVLLLALLAVFAFGGPSEAATNAITDQSGARVVVEKPFKRIISLYAAHTENLFSLGLDKEIIGVSPDEAFPPKTLTKPVFSYHDDVEKFIAAQPDLVLLRPMITLGYPNFVKALQEAGITVVSLQPRTIEDVHAYWRDLGTLTGREAQAEAMIRKLETGLRRIGTIVNTIPEAKRKKVYFEAIHGKMLTFSPSSISMFVLKSAGGINVAEDAQVRHDTNIADYGKEHILSRANEIDVFLAQKGAMNHPSVRQIREESGFQIIKAVREKHIYIIDEKIVSRPTLRLLDGIYEIGRFLYPEKFNDITAIEKVPALSRAQFAEMFCKMTDMPLKTPDYRQDILKRTGSMHRYGDFSDVNYTGDAYKFIETAVYRGIFPDIHKSEFFPDRPVTRSTVAYTLFVYFNLPEPKEAVSIKDVKNTDPFFEQIRTAAGLGLMDLTPDGLFRPDGTVSGEEAFQIVSKARKVSGSNAN
jgi:iron complex transport system substrate-binding protein